VTLRRFAAGREQRAPRVNVVSLVSHVSHVSHVSLVLFLSHVPFVSLPWFVPRAHIVVGCGPHANVVSRGAQRVIRDTRQHVGTRLRPLGPRVLGAIIVTLRCVGHRAAKNTSESSSCTQSFCTQRT
jgi:hypothetical protein